MRKPKGKLVALLAGAVVVVLVAMSWRDIYCQLFLDPRLVGRWEMTFRRSVEFDRVGNLRGVDGGRLFTGTYRIDGSKGFVISSDNGRFHQRDAQPQVLFHPRQRGEN